MAFSASNDSSEPRAVSYGPYKVQRMKYSVASGDTSGTITADALSSVDFVMIDGPCGVRSSVDSISGNVVTLAFVNPGATLYGNILAFGK